ncbi:hypothetical protein ColKHC_01364 [Colletotrichum higginsianum]|nr:hypothetical protein ColKHC_01364 [Colletotrichum higginsianum]
MTSSTTQVISAISGPSTKAMATPTPTSRTHRMAFCDRPSLPTKRRQIRKGVATRNPTLDSGLAPQRSQAAPTRGPSSEGVTNGRKIRPAPTESQSNVSETNRGRVLSKDVVTMPWTRVPQSAARRRGLRSNVKKAGLLRLRRLGRPILAVIGMAPLVVQGDAAIGRRRSLFEPGPGRLDVDGHQPHGRVDRDQAEAHGEDGVVAAGAVHETPQHRRREDARAHRHAHPPHGLAHVLAAGGVDDEGEADRPDQGGGRALQQPADDEEGDAGPRAQEGGRSAQEQETGDHGHAAGGDAVGEIAPYCCEKAVGDEEGGSINCKENRDPELHYAMRYSRLTLASSDVDAGFEGKRNDRDDDAVEEDVLDMWHYPSASGRPTSKSWQTYCEDGKRDRDDDEGHGAAARDPHPGVQQSLDDLAQAVVELARDDVLEPAVGVRLHVAVLMVAEDGLGALKVRVLEAQAPGVALVQGPEHGVGFAEEQPAAGSQEPGHHVGPSGDRREPAEGPDAGEHHVVASRAQGAERRVHVRLHKTQLSAPAIQRLLRQKARLTNALTGDVEPRHGTGAEPGEG